MPFKTMLDDDARYSDPVSHELMVTLRSMLYSIMEDLVKDGYNPREVANLICEEVNSMKLDLILTPTLYRKKEA